MTTFWPMTLMCVLHFITAIAFATREDPDWPMVVVFVSYGTATLGLIWGTR